MPLACSLGCSPPLVDRGLLYTVPLHLVHAILIRCLLAVIQSLSCRSFISRRHLSEIFDGVGPISILASRHIDQTRFNSPGHRSHHVRTTFSLAY